MAGLGAKAGLLARAAVSRLSAWWDGDFRPMGVEVAPRNPVLSEALQAALPALAGPTAIMSLLPPGSIPPVPTSVFVSYRAGGNGYVLPVLLPRDGDLTLPPSPTAVLSVGGRALAPSADAIGSRRRPLEAVILPAGASGVPPLDVTPVVLALAGPLGDFHEGVGVVLYVTQLGQYVGWPSGGHWSLRILDDWGSEWIFAPEEVLRLPIAGPVPPPTPPTRMAVPALPIIEPSLPLPRGIVLGFEDPTLGPPKRPSSRTRPRRPSQ